MWGRLKTLVLATVVGAAALVPLFGDPRSTPVTHALWARMLLRSLDMTDAVRASTQASQVFSTLAWRDSLSYPANRYLRAEGAVAREEGGHFVLAAGTSPAEVVYALAVAQPGDYQLRARLAGQPGAPATAEVLPMAGGTAIKAFTLIPAAEPGWVFAGSTHLDPGAYAAQFLLPPGSTLSQVEIAPPCVNSIEPQGGWKPAGVTTSEDLAITALKAIDVEHELPPGASPIEMTGDQFQVEAPVAAVEERAKATGLDAMTLRARRSGLRAIVSVDLPEAGLYSVSAFISPGAGQRWLADGCRKAVVCPGQGSGWRPIMSQAFAAGRHTVILTLGDGATVERVRFELKKSTPADYLATLKRLGFDPGPEGPVARGRALDAARFVRDQRRSLVAALCGDTVPFEETPTALPTRVAGAAPPGTGGETQPPAQPPGPPPGPVEPPIGPPILPPQPPGSPTQPTGGGL
jgi:hypothetical protein